MASRRKGFLNEKKNSQTHVSYRVVCVSDVKTKHENSALTFNFIIYVFFSQTERVLVRISSKFARKLRVLMR
jgi:hypothetical protein